MTNSRMHLWKRKRRISVIVWLQYKMNLNPHNFFHITKKLGGNVPITANYNHFSHRQEGNGSKNPCRVLKVHCNGRQKQTDRPILPTHTWNLVVRVMPRGSEYASLIGTHSNVTVTSQMMRACEAAKGCHFGSFVSISWHPPVAWRPGPISTVIGVVIHSSDKIQCQYTEQWMRLFHIYPPVIRLTEN